MTDVITIPVDSVLERLGPNGEHWLQGAWQDKDGNMCLHQGIRVCMPEPGDAYLVEQVAAAQGWGPGFNDSNQTVWGDVAAALSAHREITETDLADTFGPNWRLVRVVVNQTATLTTERAVAAWAAHGAAARVAARVAARAAARAAAQDAAGAAAWAAHGAAAWVAAQDAAWAVVVRDLIGQHGFTQEHYDVLTAPWRAVFPHFDEVG